MSHICCLEISSVHYIIPIDGKLAETLPHRTNYSVVFKFSLCSNSAAVEFAFSPLEVDELSTCYVPRAL